MVLRNRLDLTSRVMRRPSPPAPLPGGEGSQKYSLYQQLWLIQQYWGKPYPTKRGRGCNAIVNCSNTPTIGFVWENEAGSEIDPVEGDDP
jgi:hypothetical protein